MTFGRRSLTQKMLKRLLRLLPAEFRGDFGEAIEADLDERYAENRRWSTWLREVAAVVALALRQHGNALLTDVRYALRLMARTPAFTVLALTMLALGTGANVAMFTVIDAVMLRSPFPEPDRLAIVRVADSEGRPTPRVSAEQFESLASAPRTLDAVAAIGNGSHMLTGVGDPRRPDFECVTASMFDVLGTRPAIGRTFTREEDRRGAGPTVVLSFSFWQQLGRPAVSSVLRLNDTPVTLIGVMPDGFAGPYSRNDVNGWLPLNLTLSGNGLTGCRTATGVNLFARVRADLSLPEAEAALPGLRLTSLTEETFENLRTPFLALMAAAGCVLLIACLNVGGLQLERAVARRREIALRLALGASRGRIVRQTLTEHLLIGLFSAAAGLATTVVTLRGVVSLLPTNVPHLEQIAVNRRVLFAALALAGGAAVISSLLPIVQTIEDPGKALADRNRSTTRHAHWSRRALVVAQIAISIVVLVGAGLMIQTFLTLRPSEPGFEPRGKLTTLVRLPGRTPELSARFFDQLFDRVRAIPFVRGVSGSSYLPMMGVVSTTPVTLHGKTVNAFGAVITPDYISQMEIGLVAGRTFTAGDTVQSPPVAIVNELLAERLRPGGAVLGEYVLAPGPRRSGERPIERQIVGVIANTRSIGGHTRPSAEFYVPYAQSPTPLLYLIAEADQRQHGVVTTEIRRAIRILDQQLVVENIESFADLINTRVARPRLGAWLLGIFAAMALLLSAVGLMTTVGWWVSQRLRELGIRVALGASRLQVMRLVLGQGITLAGSGILAGCLAAAGVSRYMQGWIYGIAPLDTRTFGGAAIIMFVIGCGAMYVPLRRAVTVDPVMVLKTE